MASKALPTLFLHHICLLTPFPAMLVSSLFLKHPASEPSFPLLLALSSPLSSVRLRPCLTRLFVFWRQDVTKPSLDPAVLELIQTRSCLQSEVYATTPGYKVTTLGAGVKLSGRALAWDAHTGHRTAVQPRFPSLPLPSCSLEAPQ